MKRQHNPRSLDSAAREAEIQREDLEDLVDTLSAALAALAREKLSPEQRQQLITDLLRYYQALPLAYRKWKQQQRRQNPLLDEALLRQAFRTQLPSFKIRKTKPQNSVRVTKAISDYYNLLALLTPERLGGSLRTDRKNLVRRIPEAKEFQTLTPRQRAILLACCWLFWEPDMTWAKFQVIPRPLRLLWRERVRRWDRLPEPLLALTIAAEMHRLKPTTLERAFLPRSRKRSGDDLYLGMDKLVEQSPVPPSSAKRLRGLKKRLA